MTSKLASGLPLVQPDGARRVVVNVRWSNVIKAVSGNNRGESHESRERSEFLMLQTRAYSLHLSILVALPEYFPQEYPTPARDPSPQISHQVTPSSAPRHNGQGATPRSSSSYAHCGPLGPLPGEQGGEEVATTESLEGLAASEPGPRIVVTRVSRLSMRRTYSPSQKPAHAVPRRPTPS